MKNKIKVLVVDDDESTLDFFERIIQEFDPEIEIYLAPNGHEGLDVFRRYTPQILFVDIAIPGFDGLELIKKIQKEDVGVKLHIWVVTGAIISEYLISAQKAQNWDLLPKPFDAEDVEKILAVATV